MSHRFSASRTLSLKLTFASFLSLACLPAARAAVEGPMTSYTGTGIGYRDALGTTAAINDSGLTVGGFNKYDGTTSRGIRAVVWEAGDPAGTELAILNTNSSGTTNSRAYDVNNSGIIAGTAQTYQGNVSRGVRPVVWDASGNLIQLATLGANSGGTTTGTALFINDSGVVAGTTQKYDGGNLAGSRPVRWDAATGAVTELGILETNAVGIGGATVAGLNSSGAMAGNATLFSIEGETRPVRWDAGSTTPVALKPLGFNSQNQAETTAIGINSSGAVLGNSLKYSGTTPLGARGVVWAAGADSTTTPVELAALTAPAPGGTISSTAMVFNDSGSVAGSSQVYTPGNAYIGATPVRWDATATGSLLVPVAMETLGVDTMGRSQFTMNAMNDEGWIAGMNIDFDNTGTSLGEKAVLWAPDNSVLDLNTLLDPGSGWTLTSASSITNTGWVSGIGSYDPDGAGPLSAYSTVFRLNVPQAAVPEPTAAFLTVLTAAGTLLRRRRRGH